MHYVRKGSFLCPFCATDHKYISNLLGHIGGKHKREEMESLIRGDTGTDMVQENHHCKVEEYIPKEHRGPLSTKTIPSNSINDIDRLANGDENENDKNCNSIKDETSPSRSPTEHIVSVETVALPPEPHLSSINPDDDCQIDNDLKIETIESVLSDSKSGQIQKENFP